MKRFLFCVIWVVLAVPAWAQWPEQGLIGLKEARFVVEVDESLDYKVLSDTATIALARKLPELKTTSDSQNWVILRVKEIKGRAAFMQLYIKRVVVVSSTVASAAVWRSGGGVLYAGPGETGQVMKDRVEDLIIEFAAAYLKANPPARTRP